MLVPIDLFTILKELSSLRNRISERCEETIESLEALQRVIADIELLSAVMDFEVVCQYLRETNAASEHRFQNIIHQMENDLREANEIVDGLKECSEDVLPHRIESDLNRIRQKLEARIPVFSNLSIFVNMLFPSSGGSAKSTEEPAESKCWEVQPRSNKELRDRLQQVLLSQGLNDEVFALFMAALGANDTQGSSSAGLVFIDPSKLSKEDFPWHQVYKDIQYEGISCPRNVVLKVFNLKESIFGFQEALRLNLFRTSPNIVTLEGVTVVRVRKEDRLALVMDYGGVDLQGYLEQHPNLSPEERMELIEGVLKGVMQLHVKDCVHGDLSLKNIFYDPVLKRVQIGDFGAARTSIAETFKHSLQTTPQYCAPEFTPSQAKTEVHCTDVKAMMAADVYSVGVIVWEIWHNELVYSSGNPLYGDCPSPSTPRLSATSSSNSLNPLRDDAFRAARQKGYLNEQHEADKVSYSVGVRGFKVTSIESQVKMVFQQTLRKEPKERKRIHEVYQNFMKASVSNVVQVKLDQYRRKCTTAYALMFVAVLVGGSVGIAYMSLGGGTCSEYYDNTHSVGSTRLRQSTCYASTVVSSEALGPAAGYRMRVATGDSGSETDLTAFDACLDSHHQNNVAILRTRNSTFDIKCTAPVTFSRLADGFPSPQNSTLDLHVLAGTVELRLIHRHTQDYGKVSVVAGVRIRYNPWKRRNESVSFGSGSTESVLIQWGLTSAFNLPRFTPIPTITPSHTMSFSPSRSESLSSSWTPSETPTSFATRSISPSATVSPSASPTTPIPASRVNTERKYQQRAGVSCGLRHEGGEVGSGGYVIAWESTLESGATDVLFKIYSPENVVLVNDTSATVASPYYKISPSVACLFPEGFVIGWTTGESYTSNHTVYGRLFDNSGLALSGEVQLSKTLSIDQIRAEVAAFSVTEGFVTVWQDELGGDRFDTVVRVFSNSSDMTYVDEPMVVNVGTVGYNSAGHICTIPGTSDFVVVWTNRPLSGYNIHVRKWSNGTFSNEIQVSEWGTTNSDGYVACLDGGNVAVVWMLPDSSSKGIAYKVYDSNLHVVHAATYANVVQNGLQRYPEVAALDGGNFVVVWSGKKDVECILNEDIIMRVFNSAGDPLSSDIVVFDSGLECPGWSIGGFRPSANRLLGTEFQVIWSHYDHSDFDDIDANHNAGAGDVLRVVYTELPF